MEQFLLFHHLVFVYPLYDNFNENSEKKSKHKKIFIYKNYVKLKLIVKYSKILKNLMN